MGKVSNIPIHCSLNYQLSRSETRLSPNPPHPQPDITLPSLLVLIEIIPMKMSWPPKSGH